MGNKPPTFVRRGHIGIQDLWAGLDNVGITRRQSEESSVHCQCAKEDMHLLLSSVHELQPMMPSSHFWGCPPATVSHCMFIL